MKQFLVALLGLSAICSTALAGDSYMIYSMAACPYAVAELDSEYVVIRTHRASVLRVDEEESADVKRDKPAFRLDSRLATSLDGQIDSDVLSRDEAFELFAEKCQQDTDRVAPRRH